MASRFARAFETSVAVQYSVFVLQVTNTTGACHHACVLHSRRPPIQRIWQRQQVRSDKSDDVPYVLARTARSSIHNEAAIALEAKGVGNQTGGGEYKARIFRIFWRKGMEGIPRVVVEPLLRR